MKKGKINGPTRARECDENVKLSEATVSLSDFVENPENPSMASDEDIQRLAGKLKRVPLGLTAMRIAYVTDAIEGKRMVISGNKRLRVLKMAYGEDGEVPREWFADVTAMSEAERHEFIVTANVSDGEWDVDKLLAQYDKSELGELMPSEDLEKLLGDLESDTNSDEIDEEKYTSKVTSPQYEIKGENPSLDEICDLGKYTELVNEIDGADGVNDDVRQFLKVAASRHIVFDYAKIAEYYAHAPANIQRLMEKSALVIIDLEDAIQNGYVKMCSAIESLRKRDIEGDEQ